ncbi:MAG: hypothetical protein C0593_08130 [Marinilabiliales bacterium]|nr:MAG: hypothetical protein C0593_08130 [Marinilabiliales bacterium]
MKTVVVVVICLFLFFLGCNNAKTIHEINQPLLAGMEPVVIQYFDTLISDDFQCLEDLKNPMVLKWFEEQGEYANSYLFEVSGRENLIQLMEEYDKRSLSHLSKIKVTQGNSYFYLKRKSDEAISVLCYRKSLNAKEDVIFTPDDFTSDDDNSYSIYDFSPDWNGEKVAIAISSNGSDKMKIVIYDLRNECFLPHVINNCFNASNQIATWMPDNDGFLYLGYNNDAEADEITLLNTMTMYYHLGDDVSKARDIFSKKSQPSLEIMAEDFPDATLSDQSSNYLIGVASGANNFNNGYYLKTDDINSNNIVWTPLYEKDDRVVQGAFINDEFVYITVKDAPNGCIARVRLDDLHFESPEILVYEKEGEVIQDFEVTSSGIYFTTTKNGVEAKLYFLNGSEERMIKLPGKYGRIFIESKSFTDPDIWVTGTGWLTEMKRYKYDLDNNEFFCEDLNPALGISAFDDFIIEELVVESHDGEMVPLSVISKNGTKKDGLNPTLLYGYGAYGISWRPYFMPDWLTWVEKGGVLCFSHIRGGGEKGDLWHKMGQKNNKPNSWEDFIACAEYLIDNKYTSDEKLVIYGGSAGGVVIGKSMTERPDLFAAVVCEVGMLNATRFENMPGGLNHAKEFGHIADSVDCRNLISMDAFLHLKNEVKYPPFLAIVGMNDLRVSPWQTGKFVAKLQRINSDNNPTLMMVDFEEGHYFNSTKAKSREKLASIFSFAFMQTGHPEFKQKNDL